MKQLDLGISLFAPDRGDMFPAAGWGSSTFNKSLSWDTYIYGYVGGSQNMAPNVANQGFFAVDPSDADILKCGIGLPIMVCPADTTPKVRWMHVNGDPTQPLQFSPRTYAMNSAGFSWGVDIQVDPQSGTYPLPDLTQPNRHGVGIYWVGKGFPDPEAKGYPVSAVKDPSGTILLCENPNSQGAMGNQWPCCCCGPYVRNGMSSWTDLFQIDPAAPTDEATLIAGGGSGNSTWSEGALLYKAHNNRFNYAFHDGHVEALRYEDTVGSGTLNDPAGMWTAKPGD
jgi:prepilin-type processing-associated H-X9-DG protein